MAEGEGRAGGRLLCIGDVHGCARELEHLLAAVRPLPADHLVFLGDYVDRGPESAATVAMLISLRADLPATVFLRGNHEDMFLDFLGLEGNGGAAFVANGGAQTLASYGIGPAAGGRVRGEDLVRRIPQAHTSFLRHGLRPWFVRAGFLFVHAGLRPGVPLSEQRCEDLLWIREEFLLAEHGLAETVVFGHTPHRDVWFGRRRKIGLDTGCVYGGFLSCIDLSGGLLFQVRRGASETAVRDVRRALSAVAA